MGGGTRKWDEKNLQLCIQNVDFKENPKHTHTFRRGNKMQGLNLPSKNVVVHKIITQICRTIFIIERLIAESTEQSNN